MYFPWIKISPNSKMLAIFEGDDAEFSQQFGYSCNNFTHGLKESSDSSVIVHPSLNGWCVIVATRKTLCNPNFRVLCHLFYQNSFKENTKRKTLVTLSSLEVNVRKYTKQTKRELGNQRISYLVLLQAIYFKEAAIWIWLGSYITLTFTL